MDCNCRECYWNIARPSDPENLQCVSEDFLDDDFKPTPNDIEDCKHSWPYIEACGHKKFKDGN